MKASVQAVVLALAIVVACHSALADEQSPRELGSHTFLVPEFTESSLVATTFGFTQGVMMLSAPGLSLRDSQGNTLMDVDLSLLGVMEQLDLGVAFTDWIGIEAVGAGFALVGANADSAVISGALGQFSGAGAVVVRWLHLKSTQASVRLGGGYGYNMKVSPLGWAMKSINEQELADSDDLLGHSTSVGFDGSLAAAQAFGRLFGIQASASLGYDREVADGDVSSSKGVTFGFTPELDLAPVRVPIALSAEYHVSYNIGSGDMLHTLGGGAYYSGRKELQLGLLAATVLYPKDDDFPEGRSFRYGQFVMRYFF